ncbi:MAG TPA: DNA-processing protein DprA [Flavisolibacter sp.]|nr:DNA-processing protein DprA [Flavisolibacter sp.]
MELLYQLALTLVPNIGDVQARILLNELGEASAIFKERPEHLEKIEGIGSVRARSIKTFNDFEIAEQEIRFIEKYNIKPLFLTEKDFPVRLLHCYDGPILLFYKGEANLNNSKVLSIVGTRSFSEYGKQVTEQLVKDLAGHGILIVSGLAFGIDSIAHKAALQYELPTVGVVGHGLDTVYPVENTGLAKEMVKKGGGMLTEFFSGTQPEKHHFPLRNRIVGGISDATILVETSIKGGSMITAKLADAYNRDVFAVPGRTTDKGSSGCNHLIKYNKAILLTDASDLLEVMGWKERKKEIKRQRELFIELSAEEQQIIQILQGQESAAIDEIHLKTGLTSSAVAAAVLNLEIQNIIKSLPGKLYKLI